MAGIGTAVAQLVSDWPIEHETMRTGIRSPDNPQGLRNPVASTVTMANLRVRRAIGLPETSREEALFIKLEAEIEFMLDRRQAGMPRLAQSTTEAYFEARSIVCSPYSARELRFVEAIESVLLGGDDL